MPEIVDFPKSEFGQLNKRYFRTVLMRSHTIFLINETLSVVALKLNKIDTLPKNVKEHCCNKSKIISQIIFRLFNCLRCGVARSTTKDFFNVSLN